MAGELFEVALGALSLVGKDRSRSKDAYIGPVGYRDIICYRGTRITPADVQSPTLLHVAEKTMDAFAPLGFEFMPGDLVQWRDRDRLKTARILSVALTPKGHKHGGPVGNGLALALDLYSYHNAHQRLKLERVRWDPLPRRSAESRRPRLG